MKSLRYLLLLFCLLLVIPSALAQEEKNALFPSIDSVIDSITLGQTHDEKVNAFMSILHNKEDEIGLLYRQWSPEGLAWVTSVESRCGIDYFNEKYILPTEDDLSRNEVIATAKKEVSDAFGKCTEDLHPFQVAFFQYRDASQPMWYVSFVEGGYALLTRDGKPTESPDHQKYFPAKQFELYGATITPELAREQYGEFDYMWPLEAQATLLGRALPDPSLLGQVEAEAIARRAACEKYGMSEETLLSDYRVYPTYFSSEWQFSTDTWRFLFMLRYDSYFQIFVDAITGEVVKIADATDEKG